MTITATAAQTANAEQKIRLPQTPFGLTEQQYDRLMNEMRKAVLKGEKVDDPYASHRAFEYVVARILDNSATALAPVAIDEYGAVHSDRAWRWMNQMANLGWGELRFGISEDGQAGIWWDRWCDGEWTLGVGDTVEEAVQDAMKYHPNPEAAPVVPDYVHEAWQAWRAAEGLSDAEGTTETR